MKKENTYIFPAVLTFEKGYETSITFPDLPGCATSGIDDADILNMAKEAMGGHLWGMEMDEEEIPSPTPLNDIVLAENERAILVEVFMPSIRLEKANKSVNRTVTLPAWLNAAALERKVNFSQVLQNALIEQISHER